MKQVIRLTESDLHRIVAESVNTILSEAPRGKRGAYNYSNQFNRVRAGSYINAKNKGLEKEDPMGGFKEFVGKAVALRDINKDLADRRIRKKSQDELKPAIDDHSDAFAQKEKRDNEIRTRDAYDFYNGEADFNSHLNYDDLDDPNVMTYDGMDYDINDIY